MDDDEDEALIPAQGTKEFVEKDDGGITFSNNGYSESTEGSSSTCTSKHVEVHVIENGVHHGNYPNVPEDPKFLQFDHKGGATIIDVDDRNTNNSDTLSDVIEVVNVNPPNIYAGPAWLSCFFCCIPIAFLAVWNSDKAMKAIIAGDMNTAQLYSLRAKKLSALAIIFGILLIVSCVSLYILISKEVFHHKNF